MSKLVASIAMGQPQGRITLPADVIHGASELAKDFYRGAVESGFNECVETFTLPAWLTEQSGSWLPSLEHLGLERTKSRGEIVATAGVDQHTDGAHGYVLLIVLHNDGLKFKQGRASYAHQAGDWYIFNDRENHGVKEVKGEGAYIGWALPLKVKN
jgi:hypothetical protein